MLIKFRLAIPLLLCAFACACVTASASQLAEPPQHALITQVSAVRSLSADDARLALPVRVHGVVTVISGWKNSFFFEDATAGISINRASPTPELHQGQEIEIIGVTSPGLFAPLIVANEIKILGEGALPNATPFDLGKLSGGKLDSQWVSVQGAVRAATVKPSWGRNILFLDMDLGGGILITARILDFKGTDWQGLPTSLVSIRGVCATEFNDKRQFVGLRLFVASLNDVKVLKPGPADPFDRPLRPLSGLLRFDPNHDTVSPVKVRGVVTDIQSGQAGQGVYIQDGTEGVLVRGSQMSATPVTLGSTVEAVGFPGGGDYSPSLESSIYRTAPGAHDTVTPSVVAPADMIVDNEGFSSSPYDSRLVQLTGVLEQAIPGVDEHVLFLHNGNTVFTARLPNAVGPKGIPPAGSEVQITGVAATRVDASHEARSFRILLRSASDIVVLKSAPWWSAAHAKPLVYLLAFIVCFLIGALVIVRRESGLRQLALIDSLTGLYNRRGFTLIAEHQSLLAQRNHTAYLLFYIDVNDFKSINDTYGHKQGDLALKQIATILQECFRTSDIIARLGGDEFAVAAVDASPSAVDAMESRLEECVRLANQRPVSKFPISLSVGILVCDESTRATSFEELLDRADALMYEKKRTMKSAIARIPTTV